MNKELLSNIFESIFELLIGVARWLSHESYKKHVRFPNIYVIINYCLLCSSINYNYCFGNKSSRSFKGQTNSISFENDFYDMVRNIELKNVKSSFQQELRHDVKRIKEDQKLLILAGKTNNLYRLTTDEYNKLLTENISKSYKKTDKSSLNRINTESKNIAKDLKLEERIEKQSQHQLFITVKDHKDNF